MISGDGLIRPTDLCMNVNEPVWTMGAYGHVIFDAPEKRYNPHKPFKGCTVWSYPEWIAFLAQCEQCGYGAEIFRQEDLKRRGQKHPKYEPGKVKQYWKGGTVWWLDSKAQWQSHEQGKATWEYFITRIDHTWIGSGGGDLRHAPTIPGIL